MKKKLIHFYILFNWLLTVMIFNSCSKAKVEDVTDKQLFELAKDNSGYTWYKNSSSLLAKSSGSGHAQPLVRTRYNSIASSKLDSKGKIINGSIFPEGSIIVKELYENPTTLGRYAILYKKSNSSVADAKGWVWGYINSDGSVASATSNKGGSCINCHSQTDNIDYSLMNKYLP